jgi:hypothetical protein
MRNVDAVLAAHVDHQGAIGALVFLSVDGDVHAHL